MSSTPLLLERNKAFAENFKHGDMAALPKLNTLVLTCIDPRVDPAHILGLDLGEAVVFRNNGGRVTQSFIEETAALSLLVSKMTGTEPPAFEIVIIEHTHCGAEAFAKPEMRALIQSRLGKDVTQSAIHDQVECLRIDIERLRNAPGLPDTLTVSALLYDVKSGVADEIFAPQTLAELRMKEVEHV